jgi:D-psicose/D-tagatose/L-ribulose 3-epimerase
VKIGMNLFLWTINITEDLFPLFPELKAVGYEGLEIPIARANKPIYVNIRKLLDDLGLQCTTIFNLGAPLNPISPDKAVREKALDELKWAIDTSRGLLRSEALVGPYYSAYAVFSGKGPTTDELQWSAEVMRDAAAYAGDLRMSIEFLNRFETYLLNTTGQTVSLVDYVKHPNFGILYDTHHAHHEENNICAAITAAGDRINHVHFSESQRGTLGTGLVDWIVGSGSTQSLQSNDFELDIP